LGRLSGTLRQDVSRSHRNQGDDGDGPQGTRHPPAPPTGSGVTRGECRFPLQGAVQPRALDLAQCVAGLQRQQSGEAVALGRTLGTVGEVVVNERASGVIEFLRRPFPQQLRAALVGHFVIHR
jgi:hypothetical protein